MTGHVWRKVFKILVRSDGLTSAELRRRLGPRDGAYINAHMVRYADEGLVYRKSVTRPIVWALKVDDEPR